MTEFWTIAWHWTCFNAMLLLIFITLFLTEMIWEKIMRMKVGSKIIYEALDLWTQNRDKQKNIKPQPLTYFDIGIKKEKAKKSYFTTEGAIK